MYKMIMIDDEIESRNRIRNIMDFENHGIQVCGMYDNAIDALDYIELAKDIDLVITDIKMPFMDGLELSRILCEKFPLIKIIIITGYDEFDYAKTAIECGAIGYIMKPITTEGFEEIILKAKQLMDHEKELYNNIENLEQYKEKSKEYLTESILTSLIKEPFSDYIHESMDFLNLDFSYRYYRVLSIMLQNKKTIDEFTYYSALLKRVIGETLDKNVNNHVIIHKNKIVIILKSNEHINTSKLDVYIDTISIKMSKFYDCQIFVGVSDSLEGVDLISTLYTMANYALMQKNIIDNNSVNYYSNFRKDYGQLKVESDILDNLRFYIRYKNTALVDEELKILEEKFNSFNSPVEQNYLLLDLSSSLVRCSNNPTLLYEKYNNDIYEALKEAKEHDDLFNKIREMVFFIKDNNEKSLTTRFENTAQCIIDYAANNYSDPNLNLNKVADEMDLSVSYICALLKKEKNDTFVRILTDIRINKAKELLHNPNNKIIEIAESVGFIDPYYFSHTFKKVTGLSPKEFRATCLEKE